MPLTLRGFLESLGSDLIRIEEEIDPITQAGALCSASPRPIILERLKGFPGWKLCARKKHKGLIGRSARRCGLRPRRKRAGVGLHLSHSDTPRMKAESSTKLGRTLQGIGAVPDAPGFRGWRGGHRPSRPGAGAQRTAGRRGHRRQRHAASRAPRPSGGGTPAELDAGSLSSITLRCLQRAIVWAPSSSSLSWIVFRRLVMKMEMFVRRPAF